MKVTNHLIREVEAHARAEVIKDLAFTDFLRTIPEKQRSIVRGAIITAAEAGANRAVKLVAKRKDLWSDS